MENLFALLHISAIAGLNSLLTLLLYWFNSIDFNGVLPDLYWSKGTADLGPLRLMLVHHPFTVSQSLGVPVVQMGLVKCP